MDDVTEHPSSLASSGEPILSSSGVEGDVAAITQFMWGYQPHFRIGVEYFAERVFALLDRRLKPQAFLVGVLHEPDARRPPVCVEPEIEFWIEGEAFLDTLSLAHEFSRSQEFLRLHSEGRMQEPVLTGHSAVTEQLLRQSIREVVQRKVSCHPDRPPGFDFFVSYPVVVEGYLVMVVLGLQTSILLEYPSLKKSSVLLHKRRDYKVATSLLDATVREVLERAEDWLLKPEPGSDPLNGPDVDEVIRSAGNILCRGIVFRVDSTTTSGLHDFFRAMNAISALRYEGDPGSGKFVIAVDDHPALEPVLKFERPTELSNYRASRKLLELCRDGVAIHTDSQTITGLVKIGAYDEEREDLFVVDVVGHHLWELSHGSKELMTAQHGIPRLPRLPFDEAKLASDLRRIFRACPELDTALIVSLTRVAERESHGTLLVVSSQAEAEVRRLGNQGTPVFPCPLSPELLRLVTAIDGGIVLTPDGTCYGIGMILDGKASAHGDPARGARYNSAVRYVESAGCPCMAVVVSEDGGVDFLPNLRPAIHRASIDEALNELRSQRSAVEMSRARYRAALSFIRDHRFYLKEADCHMLNSIVPQLETKLRQQEESHLSFVIPPFEPDPTFDDDMFYTGEHEPHVHEVA